MTSIRIKAKTGQPKTIAEYTKPQFTRSCYACGGCSTVCHVNTATGKLRPMTLVHMANLGLTEELLSMPEIWYCMGCGRCANLCPMMVQASNLIQNLRAEAVVRKMVGPNVPEQQANVLKELISALWHAARALLDGNSPDVTKLWDEWARTPPKNPSQRIRNPINIGAERKTNESFLQAVQTYGVNKTCLTSCFTCRECSSSCPICLDPLIFDPLLIVRSANFALKEELLKSPGIWLCLDCGSCGLACSQNVKVARLIRKLQHMAATQGAVPKDFPLKWLQLKNEVYTHYIYRIDQFLFKNGTLFQGICGKPVKLKKDPVHAF